MQHKTTTEPDELLKVQEVATMLRTTHTTVYRLIDNGAVDGFKVGKQWRITRQSLEDYLTGGVTRAGE